MARARKSGGGFGSFVVGFVVALVLAAGVVFFYFQFGTPPVARQASTGSDQAHTAAEKHVFPLFADQATADAASYTRTIMAVSYFPGSLRGVSLPT